MRDYIFFSDKLNVFLLTLYSLLLLSFSLVSLSPENKVIHYIVNFVLCFIICSLIYYHNRNSETSVLIIILVAIFLRMILIPVDPITSDDHYRYLWDGKLQHESVNPYQYSPDENSLLPYHSENLPALVNHKQIKTIYPPLAQYLFSLSYLLFGESIAGLKLLYILLDSITMIFIGLTLSLLKIRSSGLLLYAFSPLVIFEFFINAHVDILLICFLSLTIYFAFKNNFNASFFFLGCTVAAKIYTLILLPFLIQFSFTKLKTLKNTARSSVFFILPAIFFLPYSEYIANMFGTMKNYSLHWYFNNLIYKLPAELFVDSGIISDVSLRTVLSVLYFLSVTLVLLSELDFISKMSLSIFFYFLLSPTLHPWYLTLLSFLLVFRFNSAFYFWTGFVVFTNITVYFYLTTSVWKDEKIILYLEYIILILLFIRELMKSKNLKTEFKSLRC